MAVDVLEEAEYYQVTGLVDWCKVQDSVLSKEILVLAEHEEQLPGRQLLSHQVLTKLAKQSIEGERSSLFENGVNGSLVGKAGVVFISRKFKVGKESQSFLDDYYGDHPFDISRSVTCIGRAADHRCHIRDVGKPVSLAIYSDDVINPVVYVQRAMQRFNQINPRVQLDLQKFESHTGYRNDDAVAKKSTCGRCRKEVYYFCFKFLFHATAAQAADISVHLLPNTDISFIRNILEQIMERMVRLV